MMELRNLKSNGNYYDDDDGDENDYIKMFKILMR